MAEHFREAAPAQEMLYGFHSVLEALKQGQVEVDHVLIARGRGDARTARIQRIARESKVPVRIAPARALDRLSGDAAHQGVVALIAARVYAQLDDVLARAKTGGPVVLIDGVQDPRNLGAIVRSAAAAGASGIVVPSRGACGLTPAVAKAAAGALEILPVARESNIAALLPRLSEAGFRSVGLDVRAEKLWTEADYSPPVALVLGGERGLRPLVRSRCDDLVRLPVEDPVDSLNVSVAAGVVLYEAVRQRKSGI